MQLNRISVYFLHFLLRFAFPVSFGFQFTNLTSIRIKGTAVPIHNALFVYLSASVFCYLLLLLLFAIITRPYFKKFFCYAYTSQNTKRIHLNKEMKNWKWILYVRWYIYFDILFYIFLSFIFLFVIKNHVHFWPYV